MMELLRYVVFDPLIARLFYGSILGVVVTLCWLSREHVAIKLAWLMALSWIGANLAVAYYGFDRAPLLTPTLNALVAILVGVVAIRHKSRPAYTLVGLFVLEAAIFVVGYLTHAQGSFAVYLALNVVFLLRMGVVGRHGRARLVDRLARERERPGYNMARSG